MKCCDLCQYMKKILLFAIWSLVLAGGYGCSDQTKDTKNQRHNNSDAESGRVIEAAIQAHGGRHFDKHDIEFVFRERTYKSKRDGGLFTYERIFTDTTGQLVRDVLTNDAFVRYVDGVESDITDERKKAFSNSVNSVIYFALLPYFLKDPAVQSEYVGETNILGEPYDKIKVTFRQEGGGKDFEDEFLYWFHQEHHTMDYLAYNYLTDGGGSRFRKAINVREIGGIRFADFINYKQQEESLYIMNYDSLFEAGALDSLSVIETEKIQVH